MMRCVAVAPWPWRPADRIIIKGKRILLLTERAEHGYSAPIRIAMKESPLAKPEWGAKHVCENCGLKYYDMQRTPIACPSCGEKAVIVTARPRRSRGAVKPEAEAPPSKGADAVATDAKVAEDGDNDADDALLVEDDDDENEIAAVKTGDDKE